MPKRSIEVNIELSDAADVKRIAGAIRLLRLYAEQQGHSEIIEFTDEVEEALQNVDITTKTFF
jgi:hypothetical protein